MINPDVFPLWAAVPTALTLWGYWVFLMVRDTRRERRHR